MGFRLTCLDLTLADSKCQIRLWNCVLPNILAFLFVCLLYIFSMSIRILNWYEFKEETCFIIYKFQLIAYDTSTRDSLWPLGTSVYDFTKQFTLLVPFMVENYFEILTVNMGSLYNDITENIQSLSQTMNNLTTALSGYNTWTDINTDFIKSVSSFIFSRIFTYK